MKTDTSARLFDEAQQYIPGGVNSPVRAMKSVGMPQPLFISRAKGAHIWDADGNEFVDFVSSWGPMILGWGHPDVCLLYTSPSPRDGLLSRMPSSA